MKFNVVGYCLKDVKGNNVDFHVCGYENGKCLVQTETCGKVRKFKIYEGTKGDHFFIKIEGKKYILPAYEEPQTVEVKEEKQEETNAKNNNLLSDMIMDVGAAFAGIQTTKDGMLKDVKKGKSDYTPKTNILDIVHSAIKNAKLNYHMRLMSTLSDHKELIPVAQKEVEKAFIEHFGREVLTSDSKIDKIFGKSIISKLSYLAKENGISGEKVDNLIQKIVENILHKNSIAVKSV